MDGIHDMGGMQGFGRVPRGGVQEQPYHEPWERRVFALALLGRTANTDAFRHAIERLDPVTYLTAGYYGRWLAALESLTVHPGPTASAPTARRELATQPRFRANQRVRASDRRTSGHTRLPAYARGRSGVIVRLHGGWVYPDTHAHSGEEAPQHLYTVRFDSSELWGETAERLSAVHLDLFEPYLEERE